MSSTSPGGSSMSLVHEGWDHLRAGRPLAAWGSWQRALRLEPDLPSAVKALATLESAADLPAAARAIYRLRQPDDPVRRAAWNDRMKVRGDGDQDLDAMADAFGRLAAEGPDDAAAWYNRALCLAWRGANREAVACLDRAVDLEAGPAFDRAVEAWTLAEVLRQGGGAETLADDLRFAFTIEWDARGYPRSARRVPRSSAGLAPARTGHRARPRPGYRGVRVARSAPSRPGRVGSDRASRRLAGHPGERLSQPQIADASPLQPPRRDAPAGRGNAAPSARGRTTIDPSGSRAAAAPVPRRRRLDGPDSARPRAGPRRSN